MSDRAVIFDLDGTLLNTSSGIIKAVKHTIFSLGLPRLTESQLLGFVGPPVQDSFRINCNLSKEESQVVTNIYRDYYKKNTLLDAVLYDGVLALLEELSNMGYLLAIASYKREDLLGTVVNEFGLNNYMKFVIGADFGNKFTKTDIVNQVIEALGVVPANAICVGDTLYDANAAKDVGIPFVAALYGFGFKSLADLCGVQCIGYAYHPNEISRCLKQRTL